MGADVGVVGAFAMEGLTKVINLVGALSPGNLGDHEGGNMVIANLFGVTGTAGLIVGFVPAGAVHLLGSSRGHLDDSDQERRDDKHNGGKGQ